MNTSIKHSERSTSAIYLGTCSDKERLTPRDNQFNLHQRKMRDAGNEVAF